MSANMTMNPIHTIVIFADIDLLKAEDDISLCLILFSNMT